MFYSHLKGHIEALLFACGEPLSASRLADILEIPIEQLILLISEITEEMAADNRGVTILEVAGGYQMCTKPELIAIVEKLAAVQETRLSSAAMETLAIVAFRQPITKQEIENIRGVKVDKVMLTLLDRGLVKEVGRKEALGRPILYGTTHDFLKCFGLNSLDELPALSEFVLSKQLDE
ncbi:segregation and condensation protein B [Sporomusaceae bacterium FL31]|nr:segregation and condensation protein B [Sporomusaceae bacterium FL31]GCE33332.1 segregation and condensation protein B [Sporomusaceae bacterium]